MNGIPLRTLAPCFQGLIPAWLHTCSKDGVPNVTILSHVDYVDERHVALSFQFFNKSWKNVSENPQALVRLYDPDTLQAYELGLRYIRSETEGALFEAMRLRIEAIASYSGLKGIFKLISANIYEVESVQKTGGETGGAGVPEVRGPDGERPAPVPFTMKALQELSDRIHSAFSLECLLESILESLETLFGFRYSMILLAGEQPGRLTTIATRGYDGRGVGSEVSFGEGIVGMVAEARKPIRISGLLRHMLYANAVANLARESGLTAHAQAIPLPGLTNPDSQLGIPILAHDKLLGVRCVESEGPYRFHEDDKSYLEVLGGYLAIAIQNALLRERSEHAEVREAPSPPRRRTSKASPGRRRKLEITYYSGDECVLVNGEYLVRSLPAKILWKLLSECGGATRREFTNRQLRLDKSLSLPALRDNLESRLILLRRRLEQRCQEIRLVPSDRGRFILEVGAQLILQQKP